MLNVHFLNKLLIISIVVFLYYFVFKYILKKLILMFDLFKKIKKRVSKNEYFGAFEMIFLSLSHFLFCLAVVVVFRYDFSPLFRIDALNILFASVLGVSIYGFSNLICQVYVCISKIIFPLKVPTDVKSWVAMSRSGWIAHHFQCIKVFPVTIWLPVISLQVACEEFIFRGFLLKHFFEFGYFISIIVSTILFVVVQAFSMPSIISAAFPIIGALVMGAIHSCLFIKTEQIIPLVISHICFFIFVVRTQEVE